MKTGTLSLHPNAAVAEKVTTYSEGHSTSLPQYITDYHGLVEETHPRSAYMISNFQGQYLVFLAHALGAKRVLEIGVYVGYSALVWAHAVGDDGMVTGLESSATYVEMSRDALERLGVKNVNIVQGDAIETLQNLTPDEPYDIVFIDAQKSGYPRYLDTILAKSQPGSTKRLVRPGGLIIADNVLRRGLVADDSDANPSAAQQQKTLNRSEYETDRDLDYLRQFNDAVMRSGRIESFLAPLFDGISLARLVD